MTDEATQPFAFPAVQRKKVTAAFAGGRITSDGGVMLLAEAERRLSLTGKLAAVIPDHRGASRVTHPLVDILRAADDRSLPAQMPRAQTSTGERAPGTTTMPLSVTW